MRKVNVVATVRNIDNGGVEVEFTRETIGQTRFNWPFHGATKQEAVSKMVEALKAERLTGTIKLVPHLYKVPVVNNKAILQRFQSGEGVTREAAIAHALELAQMYGELAVYDDEQGIVSFNGWW